MRRILLGVLLVALCLTAAPSASVVSVKVSVTTTATTLATVGSGNRMYVEVSHACASPIFVGGSDVTTASGRQVNANASLSLTLIGEETLYAVVASGTCSTNVLKNGVQQ